MLCGAEKTGGKGNYEKHALRASQVIAAVAKVSCKHGLWLVARVNKKTVADSIFFEYDKFGRRLKSCRFSFPNSMNNTGFILAALGGSRFDKAL